MSGDWQPDVSVVVPVWNRAARIGPCIDSILESDYPAERFEVVVADNASTDGTPDVLRRYGARIRTVWEGKRGPAAARNAAIGLARGEVVAFTDSDCVVDPAWLARLIQPLRNERMGAAGGCIRAFPGGNNLEHFGERIHDHAMAIEYFRPAYVITMNLAARLETLRSVGCFDERLLRCEDVDLAYRIDQAGLAMTYVPDAIVYHHNRSNIFALMREAYDHGFHAPKLAYLHRDYRRRMAGMTPKEPAAGSRSTRFSRDLAEGETRLYWVIFRTAKRVGRLVGSLRASKLYHHV